MKKYIYQGIFLFTIIFIAAGASYLNAWTAPTQTAPNGNTPAPLNVGVLTQDKTGILRTVGFKSWGPAVIASNTIDTYSLSAGLLFGVNGNVGAKQYCDENGQNCSSILNIDPLKEFKSARGISNFPSYVVCDISSTNHDLMYLSNVDEGNNRVAYELHGIQSLGYNKSTGARVAGASYCPSQLALDGKLVQM